MTVFSTPSATPATSADRPVALPTLRLMGAAILWCAGAGLAWTAGALVLGADRFEVLAGPFGALVVAVSTVLMLLVIRPWKPKPLYRWPAVWIAGSFGRMGLTIGLAYLLYSAPTPLGTAHLWLAVVAAYLAALVGETRAYATSMKRYGPASAPAGPRGTE